MREKVINPAQPLRRLDATRAALESDVAERKRTMIFGRDLWFRSDSNIRRFIPFVLILMRGNMIFEFISEFSENKKCHQFPHSLDRNFFDSCEPF